jgi:hypothetical protein
MRWLLSVLAVVVSTEPIGSRLHDGLSLTYESGGVAQSAWVYDTVRVVTRDEFDRCVIVVRQATRRETCARADTLFERQPSGDYRASRPIGASMTLEVTLPDGRKLEYVTGSPSRRHIGGEELNYLPTTIVTRDSTGRAVRRLREDYAPSLLTALGGVFEEPGSEGGWTVVRSFALTGIASRR